MIVATGAELALEMITIRKGSLGWMRRNGAGMQITGALASRCGDGCGWMRGGMEI